ncbi:hypothetical protein DRQ36_02730 [bacterium]|nr:MAG: hypothetical protein DRQ36_02730 [bacterium]
MRSALMLALLLVLVSVALSQSGYPAGYFYAIFRGDTFCVEPVITDSVMEAEWFDYTSASMHTGLETAYESHIFFFYNPMTGNIGLVIQHNIDVTGTADATCSLYIDDIPTGCILAMSDDPGEFDLSDYPQGHWAWWLNTDGGAFYIPRDEWQFTLRTNFGSTDPIRWLYFISGDDGSDRIYLDTVLIDQEDTIIVGHGFLQLISNLGDSIYIDSIRVATDDTIEISVRNSDETIDTLYATGASHTDPHFTTISTPGMLPPDTWGVIKVGFSAADTGIYIDTVWANTNEPCGTNPIVLYVHVTSPPVHAEIVEPLPETWTSCADQPITMTISTEGTILAEMNIPSLATTTEYWDTVTMSWLPAVEIYYSGWGTHILDGSSWIWDSTYTGAITGRCLTFRCIIETAPGAVIDSATVEMYADNTATFYMNGDSIGADDDGSVWNHSFTFDMLPFMHGGADTLTIEACDLTAVAVGLDFVATVFYRVECLLDVESIVMTVDSVAHHVGDTYLDLVDSTYLIYNPIPPDTFEDNDVVHVCLDSLFNTCGGYLAEPLCWDFYVDLSTPHLENMQPPPDSIIDDPTPLITADIIDLGSGVDTSTIVFIVDGDTIPRADFILTPVTGGWNIGYTPTEPILAADSIWVCVDATDTTEYCPDNEMHSCWAFVNMRAREVWFPTAYGHPCSTVTVPLIIDGLDYSWIASVEMRFRVDPEVLIPQDIITTGSLTDGWSVGGVTTYPDSGIIEATISGTPLTSGTGGDFLYMECYVPCNAFGGDYAVISIDTIVLNEGVPEVSWTAGLFVVELSPEVFMCDRRLNRTTGTPVEDFVLTLGAMPGGSDDYDPGLDIQHVPAPAWLVNGWFPIDDPSYPTITMLIRDMRLDDPPKRWFVVMEDEPHGIVRWEPDRFPEGEFRLNGIIDMKRDSVAYFDENDTLIIDWTLPAMDAVTLSFETGWNMVSSPVLPTEIPAHEVFNAVMGVFRYVTPWHTYDYAGYIRDGEGYWVWANEPYEIPVAGSYIEGYRWAVYRGWNLIGAPGEPVSVDDIEVTPTGGILGAIYGYDGSAYVAADSLIPGEGYWLLCSDDGILHVPSSYRRRPEPMPETHWNGTLIIDNVRLAIGYAPSAGEGLDIGDIAFPPIVPNGTPRKSVLMADGFELSKDLSPIGEWELLLRDNSEIEFEIPEDIVIEINGKRYCDGDVAVFPAGNYKLKSAPLLPEEFAVLGCVPNPFNATTEIVIALPDAGEVEIEIFDISGREVYSATGRYGAGVVHIGWDGLDSARRELPSGLYFARVAFDGKSAITKAMLIK